MSHQSFLGMHWKLAAVFLAASLLSCGLVVGGHSLGESLSFTSREAWLLGLGLGATAGVVGASITFLVARSFKLRLWDAADMAGQIARGDFSARLPVDHQDEIGWLEEQLNLMAGQLDQAVRDLAELAEQNRQLAEEAGRGAALEERAKLARDLHDTVNQQLFVMAMRTAALRRRLEKLGGEAAAMVPELVVLEEVARQAHGQARELILQLRPTSLEQQGLGLALVEYVKAVAGREGWEAHLEIDPSIREQGSVGENLFRVAQEALNNCSKHAGARTVWVGLARTEESMRLRIQDDGKGFDIRTGVRPTAVGLMGIQERVVAMGGTFDLNSSPGQGTEVIVTLPVVPEGGNRP